ncbi:podocalyxin isoform X2 [Heterodontus francisci]|uniref:podocalyxin isoform X2 n=1 Tax=Heterodontus francisci TaxID=7792 RepID=UPI00355C9764
MRLLLFVCFLGSRSATVSPTSTIETSMDTTTNSINISETTQKPNSFTQPTTINVATSSSTAKQEEKSTVPTSTADNKGSTSVTIKGSTVTKTNPSITPEVTKPAEKNLTNVMTVPSPAQSHATTVQPKSFTALSAPHQNDSSASMTQESSNTTVSENKNTTSVNETEPTASTNNVTPELSGQIPPTVTQPAKASNFTWSSSTLSNITVTQATTDRLQTSPTIRQNTSTEGLSQSTSAIGGIQKDATAETQKTATTEGTQKTASTEGTQQNVTTETQQNVTTETQSVTTETQKSVTTETQKSVTTETQKNASKTNIQSKVDCVAESSNQKNFLMLKENMDCKTYKEKNGRLLGELLCSTISKRENLQGFNLCVIKLSTEKELERKLNIDISFKVDENKINEILADMKDNLGKMDVVFPAEQGADNDRQTATERKMLIAIVVTGSLLLLVFLSAIIYRCLQCKSQHKDPYLTEEMRTVDNGCHDNPGMDSTESESEMQEKKPNSKANFQENTDSWIVPMDSLAKDELEEEDTHL